MNKYIMSCPKRVLEEVLDEMQRKRGEYMKKKDEEQNAGIDGGDDTVIWKYFSEYCSIKEEQDNDDKVMGEWVSACLVASKDTIEWTQMSIYMHPMIQLIMAPVHTYRSLGPI